MNENIKNVNRKFSTLSYWKGGRAPDVLINRQSRLMAYRQFVCWVRKGQPLGKKHRIILPACVVNIIRKEFPSLDGVYEWFKECESDTSDWIVLKSFKRFTNTIFHRMFQIHFIICVLINLFMNYFTLRSNFIDCMLY